MLNNCNSVIFQSAEESLSKIQSDNEMLVSNIDILSTSLYIIIHVHHKLNTTVGESNCPCLGSNSGFWCQNTPLKSIAPPKRNEIFENLKSFRSQVLHHGRSRVLFIRFSA